MIPLLRAALLDGVPHGFTTRAGGVSTGPLASLNLARRPGEEDAHLRENWDRVARALDPALGADDVALLSQVHGAAVLEITAPTGPWATAGDADGAFTTRPGIVLAVRAADCVPILIAGPGGVAVAHAGWRGVAAGVVPATIAALTAATGDAPSSLALAIGPRISQGAFEVGEEVVDGLRDAGLDPDRFRRIHEATGKSHVDLGVAVHDQAHAAGVERIERLDLYTVGDPRLYSHRGDGPATGRLAGVISR